MVYNNKLVVAIKVAGKVLKEFGDVVYIPFGSEYTVQLNTSCSPEIVSPAHLYYWS